VVSRSVDAVIFDLDGTLADSLGDIGEAANEVLARHGLEPLPIESYKRLVGEGAEMLIRGTFRAAGMTGDLPEPVERLLAEYRAAYWNLEHRNSVPYPGVEAMLDDVVGAGLPMAVLSNKRDEFTKHLVSRRFGRWSFVEVRGEQDGVPRKPDPAAAVDLARVLDAPADRIAFVGDTAIDMRTARNAGMIPIGALWGFRSKEELLEAGARITIARPEELLGALARLAGAAEAKG
jgi:phosphoglycolate phosphatase